MKNELNCSQLHFRKENVHTLLVIKYNKDIWSHNSICCDWMQLHQPQQVNYFTDIASQTYMHHSNKQLFTINKIQFDKWLYYFLIIHFNLSQILIIIFNYNEIILDKNLLWEKSLEKQHFLQATEDDSTTFMAFFKQLHQFGWCNKLCLRSPYWLDRLKHQNQSLFLFAQVVHVFTVNDLCNTNLEEHS